MQTPHKQLIWNGILFVVLVVLTASTLEYQHLHQAALSGRKEIVVETPYLFGIFPEELDNFVARQQIYLAGNGKHDRITLPYYPLVDKARLSSQALGHGGKGDNSTGVHAVALPTTLPPVPSEAIRLRSSILLKETAALQGSPSTIPWRVQTERLGSALLASPRPSPPPPPPPSSTELKPVGPTTITRTSTSVEEPPLLPKESLSASSNTVASPLIVESDIPRERSATPAAASAEPAPRRANAVIVLMSPTFSLETVPTSVHVDEATQPPALTEDAMISMPELPAVVLTEPPAPWRCRRCQQFLEKLLPSLEAEFLRRHPYPVHIFHRGRMPSEVVQYITATLPSATRVTIEDIAGVLSEKVTQSSSTVLEPWLKEIAADLHYRRRFITAAPVPTAAPETSPPTEKAPPVGVATGATLVGGDLANAAKTGMGKGGDAAAGAVGAGNGGGTTSGLAGVGAVNAVHNNNGGTAVTGGGDAVAAGAVTMPNNNNNNANAATTPTTSGTTSPSKNGNTNNNNNNDKTNNPYAEADLITRTLREQWEVRRFWVGPLFLLSSLQSYDYFWYIDSQSYFAKPLSRDVLADVANHTCAVAYRGVTFLTHKRVSDLWSTLLAWNEQSAGHYFTKDQLRRALSWLSDEESLYGGKIYAPDCFVMSFAVTRHPAYLDFFHWIDNRPPHGLIKKYWSPLAIYTIFAELLMEKHGWDSCLLDPLSGYRAA